ncbi:MAG TPA: MlaE family lipid ABC transporter permease subunit [Xanthobacteraceae bacterium]|nr:MlaE family lipid ABC transporter permease subunit [Xanthobacteraceae bacterium]
MSGEPSLKSTIDGESLKLVAAGPWTASHARTIERMIDQALRQRADVRRVDIDLREIDRLDTFGAWLIERILRALNGEGREARLVGVADTYRVLLQEAHRLGRTPPPSARRTPKLIEALNSIGAALMSLARSLVMLMHMLGAVAVALLRVLIRPWTFRFTSMVHHMDRVGWRAVPIILMITFLIGAIIAQQGIFHFRKFGADIFVVDMVGILVLREIGVLLVCVMVAGRSGSAYTAELGAMKMREEIDALRTMGFDPIDVLILPRIVAIVLAVPILTFLGSMAALYGGGLVSWLYGGINPDVFLSRLREAITLDHFAVGMIKAPFMALIIGLVACTEGLAVKGSAESLGMQTTTSVVKSIFLVIVLDGLFAVFFAAIEM